MRHHWLIACGLCSIVSGAAAQTGSQPEPEPAPAPVARHQSAQAPDYERIGRFIYAFHRAGVSRERLSDPLIARRAPPELAGRAAALADRFDQILAKRAAVPDQDIQATLREASEVGAALRQWWSGQDQ